MRPPSDDPVESSGLTYLAGMARDAVEEPTVARLESGLRELSATVAGARRRRRALFGWTFAAAGVAAVIALLVHGGPSSFRFRSPAKGAASLAYRVEGGTVIEGGYLREAGGGGMKLAFDDGTEFRLKAGTRGRLRGVDSRGARFAIEHGTASFAVVPRAGGKWQVDVGPFVVTVKGTVFTVSWNVASERFELFLQRGRVTVSGPISGGDIDIEAGHRLVVDLPRAETVITTLKGNEEPPAVGGVPADSAPSAPAEPTAAIPSKSAPAARVLALSHPRSSSRAAKHAAREDHGHHWAEALSEGRLDDVLDEVDRLGLKDALDGSSRQDLFALADVARYRRQQSLARAALLAARRRFPDAPESADAVYLLGRVEELSDQGTERALRWYDQYLKTAPVGSYAAEALGRKMILTSKTEGAARAVPLARDYLQRFPNGTYAGSARALLNTP